MIDYLKGFGEGQFELIEENKKRIKQIQKAAKKVPKLNAARSDHVHIVANVMKYAEEEVVEDACQAIEMFEDFLVDAQKAKILPMWNSISVGFFIWIKIDIRQVGAHIFQKPSEPVCDDWMQCAQLKQGWQEHKPKKPKIQRKT